MTYDVAWRYLEKAGGAGQGDRNSTLNRLSYAILERFPDLSQSEFYELMQRWGHTCSPPLPDSELMKTVGSAWHGAHRNGAVGSKQRNAGSRWTSTDVPAFVPRIASSPVPAKSDAKVIARTYDLEDAFAALPSPIPDGARELLKAAFRPGEKVRIAPAKLGDDGGEVPDGQGYVFTLEEWLTRLDGVQGDPNGIFSSGKKTGIYVGINPGGTKDTEITAFRHALVEFDSGLTLEQQWLLYQKSKLPITAVIFSGGKSVHAWVRVDAKDRAEFNDRVSLLYGHFEASQLQLDTHNRNPARLSRLANCVRFSKRQELLALNIGCETWQQWLDDLHSDELGEPVTIDDLEDFDPKEDPDILIGDRWLCRGGSIMFVGPSGVGKSSLTMQCVVAWSLGLPVFGIAPVRPLKFLVIQAENDIGDLSEQYTGVRDGILAAGGAFDRETLRRNLTFIRDTIHTGFGFVESIRRLIAKHRPDIVVADPLLSFVGGDISRQEVCGQFLRNWLGPVSQATGVAWLFVHHTGKPPGDKESRKGWQTSDWSYAGIGSSELTNWARGVITLREVGSNAYTLGFTKRGKRAGAQHPSGEPTDTVWIRHSASGIYWEQVDPPDEPAGASEAKREPKQAGRKKKADVLSMNLHDFLAGCKPEGEGQNKIAGRLMVWLAQKHKVSISKTVAKDRIGDLLESEKLAMTDDEKFTKGPNA